MSIYSTDGSFQGRVNAWGMAWNLALDRPLLGGGFETFVRPVFAVYGPNPSNVHDVHSIYFEVLGEHGFIALGLFLFFWWLVWRMCSQVAHMSKNRPTEEWAYWLAQMIKVSMVAYLVGGAFQNLAYWDMPYYLFVAIAVTHFALRQQQVAAPEPATPIVDATTVSASQANASLVHTR